MRHKAPKKTKQEAQVTAHHHYYGLLLLLFYHIRHFIFIQFKTEKNRHTS